MQRLYDIEKVLGEGSYGRVYRARDKTQPDKRIALKTYFKQPYANRTPSSTSSSTELEPGERQSTLREIAILKCVGHHANIVQCHAVRLDPRGTYIALTYMCEDLDAMIKRNPNGLRPLTVMSYLYQLLTALDYCHRFDIIHRDVKAENILINRQGQLKLADFGIATTLDYTVPNESNKGTERMQTLWIAAPEVLLCTSHYTDKVDIWSVGCVLYAMMTGQPLFDKHTSVEQLFAIFDLLGRPEDENWWHRYNHTNDLHKALFPAAKPKQLPSIPCIAQCLCVDPALRPSAHDLLKQTKMLQNMAICFPKRRHLFKTLRKSMSSRHPKYKQMVWHTIQKYYRKPHTMYFKVIDLDVIMRRRWKLGKASIAYIQKALNSLEQENCIRQDVPSIYRQVKAIDTPYTWAWQYETKSKSHVYRNFYQPVQVRLEYAYAKHMDKVCNIQLLCDSFGYVSLSKMRFFQDGSCARYIRRTLILAETKHEQHLIFT